MKHGIQVVIHIRSERDPRIAKCGHAPPPWQFSPSAERDERLCGKCVGKPVKVSESDVVGPFNARRAVKP